jgi:long-chain acyl-CoA synthetase
MPVTRIFDLLERYKNNFNKEDALAGRVNGNWVKYSTQDYIRFSNCFSYTLLHSGLKKGDKIASITYNCPEWNFIDMGIAQAGMIHVPVYPSLSSEEHKYILKHSDAKILIVSDINIYSKLKNVIEEIKNIEEVYSIEKIDNLKNWNQIIETGNRNKDIYEKDLEEVKKGIGENDVFTIVYTSGTTGTPKGVMLSHKNLISNTFAVLPHQLVNSGERVLSFLPLCHVYERMMNYNYQYKGISIYYSAGASAITQDIADVRPYGFNTVPRLLEKIHAKIIEKGKSLGFIKKNIFFWAVNLSSQFEFNKKSYWLNIKFSIADKLIYKQFRKAVGGNIKFIVSGGSSLSEKLNKFFWAAKIPILEGYGLTEASPVISVNYLSKPGGVRFNSVGPVVEGVEIKFASDGEILVKGPNIMKGYYKDIECTSEVIDEEGWLHTGDIGKIEDNKFLKITDRKKEIFKTSGGKYIIPQKIENLLRESYFIENIMIVGDNEKFAGALISPDFNNLAYWTSKHRIVWKNKDELLKLPEVLNRYQREIDKYNEILGSAEQIKYFRLVNDEWSPVTGELSQTLKLRRHLIYKKYDSLLKEMYSYQPGEKNRALKVYVI